MLESIVLGVVLKKEITGYDIKKIIQNGIGVFYKASFGSLYPALKKLTAKGFLTTSIRPKGGRQKIFYKITNKGESEFYKWLTMPMEILEGSNTHLAKVYFFDVLSCEERNRRLIEYEENNKKYLKKLLSLENEFDELQNKECFYYKLSTLYYGICITQQTINWCVHIRKQKPLKELIDSKEDII